MTAYDKIMETGDNGRALAILERAGMTGSDAESAYSMFLRILNPNTNYRGLDYLAETTWAPEPPSKAAAYEAMHMKPWVYGETTMNDVVAALAATRARLSTADFNQAAARLFGTDALRVAVVLAAHASDYLEAS